MTQVFISYSRKDVEYVSELRNALEAALKAQDVCIWMDKFNIRAGEDWIDEVETALRQSSYMIYVHTSSSATSSQVRKEWSYFLNRGKHVIPLIVENVELPFLLETIQFLDFCTQDFQIAVKQLVAEILKLDPTPPDNNTGVNKLPLEIELQPEAKAVRVENHNQNPRTIAFVSYSSDDLHKVRQLSLQILLSRLSQTTNIFASTSAETYPQSQFSNVFYQSFIQAIQDDTVRAWNQHSRNCRITKSDWVLYEVMQAQKLKTALIPLYLIGDIKQSTWSITCNQILENRYCSRGIRNWLLQIAKHQIAESHRYFVNNRNDLETISHVDDEQNTRILVDRTLTSDDNHLMEQIESIVEREFNKYVGLLPIPYLERQRIASRGNVIHPENNIPACQDFCETYQTDGERQKLQD